MNQLLGGAVVMAFVVVALYFWRFWRQTRDTLFLLFSISFLVQGLSHTALALSPDPTEGRPAFYVPRLVAYVLIVAGIVSKNLRRSPPP